MTCDQYEKTQKKDQAHHNKLEKKLKNILTNTENKEDLTNLDIDSLSEDKKGYVRSVIQNKNNTGSPVY